MVISVGVSVQHELAGVSSCSAPASSSSQSRKRLGRGSVLLLLADIGSLLAPWHRGTNSGLQEKNTSTCLLWVFQVERIDNPKMALCLNQYNTEASMWPSAERRFASQGSEYTTMTDVHCLWKIYDDLHSGTITQMCIPFSKEAQKQTELRTELSTLKHKPERSSRVWDKPYELLKSESQRCY